MLLDDESLAPKPAVSLMVNGQWTAAASESMRQRPLVVPDATPAKMPIVPWMSPPPKHSRAGTAAARDKARHMRAGKAPKPKPEKRQSYSMEPQPGLIPGAGGGWNKNRAITVEAILAMQSEGQTIRAIAAHFGCHFTAITKRLLKHLRATPGAYSRTCACGKGKWAKSDVCRNCRQTESRREQRMAPAGRG